MLVIGGLILLIIAVIIGLVGVLGNAGAAHPLIESFSVLGYHVTGSTGTLFLFGIVVGAVALLGLSVLLAGARRSARRGRNARRDLRSSQRENAFLVQDRERLLDDQTRGGAAASSITNSNGASTQRPGGRLLDRFVRIGKPMGDGILTDPVATQPRSKVSARGRGL
jgi:hypothetical protein